MMYNLNEALQREQFKLRCNALYRKGSVVELTERRLASRRQNNYLHLIISYFGAVTGYDAAWVKERYFKRLANAETFVRRRQDPWLGEVEFTRSTADLSSAEMTTAIERFRDWAAREGGVYLPSADQHELLAQAEAEADRARRWT